MVYGDIVKKRNPMLGVSYGKISNYLDEDNSFKVGIVDGFVRADVSRPFLYTTDILTCVVLLIVMEDESWMVHLDLSNFKYKNRINNFLTKNNVIKKIYIFPGIFTNISYIKEIKNIFKKKDINYSVVCPFYDSRYGYNKTVGGIGYKFDKDNLYFFGIDADENLYGYDIEGLFLNDIEGFFNKEVISLKRK